MSFPRQEYVQEAYRTKVYTINTTEEPEIIAFKEFDYFTKEDTTPQFDGKNLFYVKDNMCIVECAKAEEVVTSIERKDAVYTQKELIIIEPRLERILANKYTKMVDDWKNQAVENEKKYQKAVSDLGNEKASYNNLPWWKKIFTFTI